MTDPITQHEQLKREQQRIQAQLEQLEKDDAYQKAVAFKKDIEDVLEMHDKTADDLLQIFGKAATPTPGKASSGKGKGKSLPMKRYTNPHTGDVEEAKSLKNPKLAAWIEKHGADTVRGWGKIKEDSPHPLTETP